MSIYLFFIYIYLLKLTDEVQYFPYTVQRSVCKLQADSVSGSLGSLDVGCCCFVGCARLRMLWMVDGGRHV